MTADFDDHLNLDAIVAFADGEMAMVAYQRAAAHVSKCAQCECEVNQQVVARSWLRAAGSPAMPMSLLDSLKSIPVAAPVERPADGVTVDPVTGREVRSDDHARDGHARGWRFRFLGAGVMVAGLAVGAMLVAADQPTNEPGSPKGRLVSGMTAPFVVPVVVPVTLGSP